MTGHRDRILSLAFDPSGDMLASSSADLTIKLWDVSTQQSLGSPLQEGQQAGGAIAFSRDGRSLTSVDADGAIVRWDTDPVSWRARACRAAGRNLDLSEWQHAVGSQRRYERTCAQYPSGAGAPADAPAARPS
jgi:hypothetical protein